MLFELFEAGNKQEAVNMGEDFRLLTPTEQQKLPRCRYTVFGRCDLDVKKRTIEECARCLVNGVFRDLMNENTVGATAHLHSLVELLKKQKLLPDESS